jgi:hypothetical protein
MPTERLQNIRHSKGFATGALLHKHSHEEKHHNMERTDWREMPQSEVVLSLEC